MDCNKEGDRISDRMKVLYSYIKENGKWLWILLGLGGVLSMIMLLNQIPVQEIGYGIGSYLFLFLGAMIGDFWKYYQKYQKLKEAERSITITLDGLSEPRGLLEEEYQNLLWILMEDKRSSQTETERKNKELKEYYTMWVHQIKTPISALRLLLQEKNREMDVAEEMDELFQIEQYVEMVLQYMRLDSKSTDFVFRKVELDSIIREAIHKYARLFIRRKIRLDYTLIQRKVVTDEKWMCFVIGQILSNALKYTFSGSVAIYMEQEGILIIEDTGIGIRAEDLPRVFEKGYTGYNGHTDKCATGIGLYLCKRILEQLSHEIQIESLEGVGTKVRIIFLEL